MVIASKVIPPNGADQLIHPQGTNWAAVTSTPTAPNTRSCGVGRSTVEVDGEFEQDDEDTGEPYTTVSARKRRRRATSNLQSQATNNGQSSTYARTRRGPLVVVKSSAIQSQCVRLAHNGKAPTVKHACTSTFVDE